MPVSAAAVACAASRTATYRRRQPERTVLYRTVQSHLATWLELAQDERAVRHQPTSSGNFAATRVRHLAHNNARLRVWATSWLPILARRAAWSKGRPTSPATFPACQLRQWVLSVPKRLPSFAGDPAVQGLAAYNLGAGQGLRTTCGVRQHGPHWPVASSTAGACLSHVHFHCGGRQGFLGRHRGWVRFLKCRR
jgi:hypothetical protein